MIFTIHSTLSVLRDYVSSLGLEKDVPQEFVMVVDFPHRNTLLSEPFDRTLKDAGFGNRELVSVVEIS